MSSSFNKNVVDFIDCINSNSCGGGKSIMYKATSDLVIYTKPDLSCTPVKKCDDVTEIVQGFNDALCPEELTTRIIDGIVNSPVLSQIFCNSIIKKCIDCNAVNAC